MSDFFRFPHIPHLAWLGEGTPRDDKVLPPADATALLSAEVVVEEKLDGANLGFSLGPGGVLRVQNRGHYLVPPYRGQFSRLSAWLAPHLRSLTEALGPHRIVFGEWCAARHSLGYERLPDWLVVFDVYDRRAGQFWSTPRRNQFAADLGWCVVPEVRRSRTDLAELKQRVLSAPSRYRDGPLEGLVIRRESADWLERRAKLVRPDFTQAIAEHWSKRALQWNLRGAQESNKRSLAD